MRSAAIRLPLEGAFLLLIAVGAVLAGFDLPTIIFVVAVAVIPVAVVEIASSNALPRVREAALDDAAPRPLVERPTWPEPRRDVPVEPVEEPVPAVSERSARALLATATPPLPPEPAKPTPRQRIEPPAEPIPVAPPPSAPPREWNLWELERAVRSAGEQQEEWSALLIHLREFANAEGDLPVEFDELVRESFADALEPQAEPAAS